MKNCTPNKQIPPNAELRAVALRHLPLVRAAIDRLGIHAIISRLLPKDGRMKVSDADCVVLMILNILQGRVALYNMSEWLGATDCEVLLGTDCKPEAFYDDRLAGTLDRLYRRGTDDVLSEVVSAYLKSGDSPAEYSAHTDTTTLKLYGKYERNIEPGEPTPTYGHSKDYRPDLKQLVYGLSLHGAVGIPLCASTLDGNTSDQIANRWHIDKLHELLPPKDDVTLVADCKLFDPVTLGKLGQADFHFVTLVPRTYSLRGKLVELVAAKQEPTRELPELARYKGRTKKRPDRVYRGVSKVCPFAIRDPGSGESRETNLRFVVVESSALAEKFEAGLERLLARDSKKCEVAMKKLQRRHFDCEHDATVALNDIIDKPRLHRMTAEVVSEAQPLRRRPGRPRTGETPPTRTVYRTVLRSIDVYVEAVERARLHARFFVLATDHINAEQWPDARILAEYRQQHMVEGHTGFRWLKGPAAAAPMFLKTPRRIAGLGLVFVLALMVRNWIQFTLRRSLAEANETLPNMNKQPTERPTTESAFWLFLNVSAVQILVNGKIVRRILSGINEHAAKVLRLLDIPVHVFTAPRKNPAIAASRSQE